MKRRITFALACITLGAAVPLVAAPSPPDGMMELAKSKECLTCHDVTGELAAPSFQAIAREWHGVKNADVYLSIVIQRGGTQHYGCNMMPGAGARPKVSEADATALANWILSAK
jgi:cytochrome c